VLTRWNGAAGKGAWRAGKSGFRPSGTAPILRVMEKPARRKVCPICGKPADARFRPFCSRRCADVDLNRWLSGVYAVPGREGEEEHERRDPSEEDGADGG
jgi:uncharacterized protein